MKINPYKSSRGRGGGRGGINSSNFSNGAESGVQSAFQSYDKSDGSVQGYNQPAQNFDSGERSFDNNGGGGGGYRGGRGGGRGNFGGGRGGPPRGGGGGGRGRGNFGERGFDRGAGGGGGDGDRGFGGGGAGGGHGPQNPDRGYGGVHYTEEELFEECNINFSGINLKKQAEMDVNVTDHEKQEITKESCYRPTFESMGLAEPLMQNLRRLKWTEERPTPVQKHAISILQEGRDIMASAQTGSGKTGAMLIPVINYLIEQGNVNPVPGPCQKIKCMIVAPTRELATQIYQDGRRLASGTGVKVGNCYGGTGTREQSQRIWEGTSILVGTPGRLADFKERQVYQLDECEFFILDEADRMLDMGFRPQIQELERELPNPDDRTMALFSATLPTSIQEMGAEMLNQYVFIAVGLVGAANSDIKQEFHCIEKSQKLKVCCKVVMEMPQKEKVLIFVASKIFADTLGTMMNQEPYNIRSTALHGDRCQQDRDQAIREFKSGKQRVLVATNVAARGLDVKDITVVINYDMPMDLQEYIHRIGRTARIGHSGRAISFLDAFKDKKHIDGLTQILKDAGQPVPDFFRSMGGSGYGGGSSHWENSARPAEDHRNFQQFDGANARKPVDCAPEMTVKEATGDAEEDDW